MEYVERRNNKKAYIEELLRKNERIIRVDIYYKDIYNRKKFKSINEYPQIGSITDENQLKDFRKIFKRTISSRETNRYSDDIPVIAIIISYDDNIKISAWLSPASKNKNGFIDFKSHKNYGITEKNRMRFHLVMPYRLWEIIKDNMNPDSEYKKFLDSQK